MDRTEIFKKYQKMWIAFADDDEVISVGKTLDDVLEKAKKKGFDNPVTAKMPDLSFEFML
jgi:hypothetical protein